MSNFQIIKVDQWGYAYKENTFGCNSPFRRNKNMIPNPWANLNLPMSRLCQNSCNGRICSMERLSIFQRKNVACKVSCIGGFDCNLNHIGGIPNFNGMVFTVTTYRPAWAVS